MVYDHTTFPMEVRADRAGAVRNDEADHNPAHPRGINSPDRRYYDRRGVPNLDRPEGLLDRRPAPSLPVGQTRTVTRRWRSCNLRESRFSRPPSSQCRTASERSTDVVSGIWAMVTWANDFGVQEDESRVSFLPGQSRDEKSAATARTVARLRYHSNTESPRASHSSASAGLSTCSVAASSAGSPSRRYT